MTPPDRRLAFLPAHRPPYSVPEVYGAWRAVAVRLLGLSEAVTVAAAPEPEAVRDLGWRLTGSEGEYGPREALRILDALEGTARRSAPRWLSRSGGFGVWCDRTAGRVNRNDLDRYIEGMDIEHLEWRREQVRQYRAEGQSWPTIATRLGISVATARRDAPAQSQPTVSRAPLAPSVKRRLEALL